MKAADCSCRTSSGRIPSLMQEDSASSIGPRIKKNRMSVPSFFSDLARISEPVSSAMSDSSSDDAVVAELGDLVRLETKPFAQNFICVLSEQRRRLDFRRSSAEAHRPPRHLEWTDGRVLHRLHNTAPLEVCVLGQLHGVEDGACRHAGLAEDAHRLALVVLARPRGN